MADFSSKTQCDRCGAKHAAGRLFRIPWTGDLLCRDCIDKDRSLQQMLSEIHSMLHERHLHEPGCRTDLPDGADILAYIHEPEDQ